MWGECVGECVREECVGGVCGGVCGWVCGRVCVGECGGEYVGECVGECVGKCVGEYVGESLRTRLGSIHTCWHDTCNKIPKGIVPPSKPVFCTIAHYNSCALLFLELEQKTCFVVAVQCSTSISHTTSRNGCAGEGTFPGVVPHREAIFL